MGDLVAVDVIQCLKNLTYDRSRNVFREVVGFHYLIEQLHSLKVLSNDIPLLGTLKVLVYFQNVRVIESFQKL